MHLCSFSESKHNSQTTGVFTVTFKVPVANVAWAAISVYSLLIQNDEWESNHLGFPLTYVESMHSYCTDGMPFQGGLNGGKSS